MRKKISIAVATTVVVLINYVVGSYLGFTSFTFAWVLNFSLMALYTYLSSKIELKLESSWFETKDFEKEGKIYKYVGTDVFRKFLVLTGWENLTRKENPIQRTGESFSAIEYKSRSSEFGHLLIAGVVFVIALLVADSLYEARWLVITNLLFNIYPVLLQRANRPRYKSLAARMPNEKRTKR